MRQYQGAYWHKTSEKWMAIMKDRKGRLVYIGGYPTKKQASIAHDAVAKYVAAHKRN